jgi:formate-dependent nitrite reductase membrane component NrfD
MSGPDTEPPGPAATPHSAGDGRAWWRGRRGHDEPRELSLAPNAEFRSYYGRPVLKPPVWEWKIPAYLFTGGLAAGSAVLGAGADLTGRSTLRRAGRLASLGALLISVVLLIVDLGRPERFHHMLRVAKPTSPMSVGTWILTAFGPGVVVAAATELMPARWRRSVVGRLLGRLARPAGLSCAAVAPGVASYTAVLLSHTAVPGWNEARGQLPFVFTGSAAASSGGLAMVLTPVDEAAPARWFAAYGAISELAASTLLDRRLGLVQQAYTTGRARRLRSFSEALTTAGLTGTVLTWKRHRAVAVASGLALLAGSALQRLAVFEAGVASTKDPKYVIVPQRERLQEQNHRTRSIGSRLLGCDQAAP